jgi:glycosyltransferase involved in cell wall biosynthesis
VEQCLEQRDARVALVVLDNASIPSAGETLAGLDVRIIRQPANLGVAANVIRCFEVPETPWVWVIGDDDELEEGGVARALDAIARHPDAVSLNFASHMLSYKAVRRAEEVGLADLTAFVEGLDSFANFAFISTNLYNRERLLGALSSLYAAATSYVPHIAMLLTFLRREPGPVVLLPTSIVKWGEAPPGDTWDKRVVNRGFYDLLGLIEDAALRRRFGALIEGYGFLAPSLREYILRLAIDPAIDRADLRDEFIDGVAVRALCAGDRTGLTAAGLALAFEPLLVRAAWLFLQLKHRFNPPVPPPRTSRTARRLGDRRL